MQSDSFIGNFWVERKCQREDEDPCGCEKRQIFENILSFEAGCDGKICDAEFRKRDEGSQGARNVKDEQAENKSGQQSSHETDANKTFPGCRHDQNRPRIRTESSELTNRIFSNHLRWTQIREKSENEGML